MQLRLVLIVLGVTVFAQSAFALGARINWTKVPAATGYKIYYDLDAGAPYDGDFALQGKSPIDVPLAALQNQDDPKFVINAVPFCKALHVAVTAYNDMGESTYSNELAPTMVLPPDVLTAGALAEGQVHLDWSTMLVGDYSALSKFSIHYDSKMGPPYAGAGATEGASPLETLPPSTGLTLTGLTPGTRYYFAVEPVCENGDAKLSAETSQVAGVGMCGNGKLEEGEVCDGDCPAACDDKDACTVDNVIGSATTCNAVCLYQPLSQCKNDDGCCPSLCTEVTDNDCAKPTTAMKNGCECSLGGPAQEAPWWLIASLVVLAGWVRSRRTRPLR